MFDVEVVMFDEVSTTMMFDAALIDDDLLLRLFVKRTRR